MARAGARTGSLVPPVVIGFGIGGFFDGIVLHQILQWHHLVSAKVPANDLAGLEANTLADGLFHATMWVIIVGGVLLLAREIRERAGPSTIRRLVGGTLIGFGAFNVVDEIVFHAVLELHHIRPGPNQLSWDMAFAAWGIAMVAAGWWVLRNDGTRERDRPS